MTVIIRNPLHENLSNLTNLSSKCDLQSDNPWCGQFGSLEIFQVVYLISVSIFGTFGNLLVILSIAYKKRIYKNGNIFIINLAIADLIVTGIHIPIVAANVVHTGNALPTWACSVDGYIVTTTCVCSVCNLTFIAFNRYWAVVQRKTYDRFFSKKRTFMMVVITWLWSNLIVSPTIYGWGSIWYDSRAMQCSWNDNYSLSYTIILMLCAIFLPVNVISYCYFRLFKNVRERGKWMRSVGMGNNRDDVLPKTMRHEVREKKRRSLQREINLLKTLATTVLIFVLCWVPYGIYILIPPELTPAYGKKIVSWLGLSNSAVNFVIYGVMNKVYRKGYKDFLRYIFCCKNIPRMTSAVKGVKVSHRGDGKVMAQVKANPCYTNNHSYSSTQSTPLAAKKIFTNGVKNQQEEENRS